MTPTDSTAALDIWALVELFGHQKIVGHCTEANIAGSVFLRVDVPTKDGEGIAFTRFYGGSAIYAINPIAKEIACELSRNMDKAPVQIYDVPALADKIRGDKPDVPGPSYANSYRPENEDYRENEPDDEKEF